MFLLYIYEPVPNLAALFANKKCYNCQCTSGKLMLFETYVNKLYIGQSYINKISVYFVAQ